MKQSTFKREAVKIVEALGAKHLKDAEYSISTKFGNLWLKVVGDASKVFTVFAKFEEVARAYEFLDCNRFTGKWNFHYMSADECLFMLDSKLDAIRN